MRFKMPGKSYEGPLPELTKDQRTLAKELESHVDMLAGNIGERNVYKYLNLKKAENFIQTHLTEVGYKVERQVYKVRGRECANLIVEIAGTKSPKEIVIVGGHYDSVSGCPGANDNGSGAAATLALARLFAKSKPDRTLRFVLFTNEEPPWFQTNSMGSVVYAKRCRDRKENVVAMLSLETIGFYSDKPMSQKYPLPLSLFYPSTGNFVAFVGDQKSSELVARSIETFREKAKFPSEGAALPAQITGVGWSDHWSFWQSGYRGIMITDTAPFRYPHYHKKTDTTKQLDFERTARVVDGLKIVIEAEVNRETVPD
jgi:Zn-dependent M28 family amino/carboxypeptidase